MKVYKFGGASVKDASGVKNVCSIITSTNDNLVVVVSAMAKTTNALERVLAAYLENKPNDLKAEMADLKIFTPTS